MTPREQELIKALEIAEQAFLSYAYLHREKNTVEGRIKAWANEARAKEMRAAIDGDTHKAMAGEQAGE